MGNVPERVTADEARVAVLDTVVQAAQGYETQPFTTQVYAYIDQTEAEIARKDKAFAGTDSLLQASQEKLRRADAEIARLREALESIAANTCCDGCQEAARVARRALNPETTDEEVYGG